MWPVNFAPNITSCHVLHRDTRPWVTWPMDLAWPQHWEIGRSDWLINWLIDWLITQIGGYFFKLNTLFMMWFVPTLHWSCKINGLILIWYIWCIGWMPFKNGKCSLSLQVLTIQLWSLLKKNTHTPMLLSFIIN